MTDLSGYRILVVDDVLFSRETVMRLLRSMGAPEVEQAEHGLAAMEALKANPAIDAVISDFNMPKMNGLELLKAVRAGTDGVERAMPFAMLTGYSDKHLVEMALALDVNAFLIKPVSKAALGQRLEKMLSLADDTQWLRPVDDYHVTEVVASDGRNEQPAAARKPAAAGKKPGAAAAPDAAAPVARALSSLSGKFDESDLSQDIAAGVDRLVEDTGAETATRLVSVLDGMETRGVFKLEDLASALSPGAARGVRASVPPPPGTREQLLPVVDIPSGSTLSRDLKAGDGSTFIVAGTQLTSQVVSVLILLEQHQALTFHESAAGHSGLFVHAAAGLTDAVKEQDAGDDPVGSLGSVAEVRVGPDDIPPNSLVTRNLYLSDGRIYLPAGSRMTPRVIALLRDLYDLGNIDQDIFIAD